MSRLASWVEQFGLSKGGVIHVGAHEAQEANEYAIHALEPVLWFEAVPSLVARASERLALFPRQKVYGGLLWSEPDQVKILNLSSNDLGSSSVFDFHLHSASYPEVKMNESLTLKTTTLNIVIPEYSAISEDISFLVLDVQGAELEVLKGSTNILRDLDAIMVEVSIRELYKGAPVYLEVIEWLTGQGFTLIADDINHHVGWGDALFLRSPLLQERYPQIQPLTYAASRKMPSWTVFTRGILVKIGIKPEYFTRKFLTGLFRR